MVLCLLAALDEDLNDLGWRRKSKWFAGHGQANHAILYVQYWEGLQVEILQAMETGKQKQQVVGAVLGRFSQAKDTWAILN